MEFHKHQDLWGLLKKINIRQKFADEQHFLCQYKLAAEARYEPFAYRRADLESRWSNKGRPYYNVYPAILPMLLSLNLDIPCSFIKNISVQPIEIRLPMGLTEEPLVWEHGRIKSILLGMQLVAKDLNQEELIDGMCICFDTQEVDEAGHPVLAFNFFPLRDDMTIEEAIKVFPKHNSLDIGIKIPEATMIAVVRLCACLALIDHDSDMITPDILSKDKGQWEGADAAMRQHMIDMARKRGKSGWDIGISIERSPHYRRPHPALVRFGKGRKFARIVMRKGSVVHRSKLTTIPTGFENDDRADTED
jgi:L-fucose mutarotase/ribose pyranase (RbsD/FucU family)